MPLLQLLDKFTKDALARICKKLGVEAIQLA